MVHARCRACSAEFEVDFAPGTEFACGGCGAVVTTPSVVQPLARAGAVRPAATPAGSAPRQARDITTMRQSPLARRRPKSASAAAPRSRKSIPLPAIIGGGVVLAGGLVVAIVLAMRNRPPQGEAPASTPTTGTVSTAASRAVDPFVALKQRAQTERSEAAYLLYGEEAWKRMEAARQRGAEEEARRLASELRWAYREVVKSSPDHEVARRRLGDVLFDRAVVDRQLRSQHLGADLKTDLELLLEELDDGKTKGKDRVWLAATDPVVRRFAELQGRIEGEESRASARASDPFYAQAERLGEGLSRGLRRKEPQVSFFRKGITGGEPFFIHAHKPYVLVIQRDPAGGEQRIGSELGQVLDALQESFYAQFAAAAGLRPMTAPTPVIVLRDLDEYKKYLRIDDASRPITSGGHYEPWSNQLVIFLRTPPEDREVLFHEGTHQIVEFAMNTVGGDKGMRQALWFSEGIADYFGGHGREWDDSARRYRYVPGLLNPERISTLASSKENGSLFPLAELLEYRRSDYVADNQDPSRSIRVSNAYAQGWGLCYYLNVWAGETWRERFARYVKLEFDGQSGKAAFAAVFGEDRIPEVEAGFLKMIDELAQAQKEGRIVEGKLLPKKP